MARRATDGDEKRSQRFAALLLMILPGFMFLGLLAPGAVVVEPEAEGEPEPVIYRPVQPGKRPLLGPSVFTAGLESQAVDIAALFIANDFARLPGQRLAGLPSFQGGADDTILLDDSDDFISEEIFQSSVEPTLRVDNSEIWIPELFDIIPPTGDTYGYSQFSDFSGGDGPSDPGTTPTPIVPEPGSAGLLALGLAGLAARTRSSRA